MAQSLKFLVVVFLSLFCLHESAGQTCRAKFNHSVNDSMLTVIFSNTSSGSLFQSFWDFGDSFSQAASNQAVTHTYQATGEFLVKLRISGPGCLDSISKTVCVKCIFPGDANNDGIVNNADVLHVGIGYGAVGPIRINTAPDVSASCAPWVGSTGTANFSGGHNLNHADCDGNGVINLHDVSLIDRNYGLSAQKGAEDDCINAGDVPLYFEVLDSIPAGTSVNVAVMLGNNLLPALDVYGIAYTLHYSEELVEPGTVGIDYGNSLFGSLSDIIYLNEDSGMTGKIETAISRIDHNNLNIIGKIGEVNFVMEENLAQKTMLTDILNLSFSNIVLIRNDETVIPVCAKQDSAVVYEKLLTSDRAGTEQRRISIYPNPAFDFLQIDLMRPGEYDIVLANILGKEILKRQSQQGNVMLDLSDFSAGIYFITISNEEIKQTFKLKISGNRLAK